MTASASSPPPSAAPVKAHPRAGIQRAGIVPTSSSSSPSSCTPDHSNGTLTDWARGPGRTELNKKINFAVIKFLCACAIPPTVIDSKEWKQVLVSSSGGQYQAVSSKFFVNALIPREAAQRVEIRDPQSVYTCTTEQSGRSTPTGEILIRVMNS
ncbi:hypothetical protein ACEPAG_1649 [Sanghuangporus baumii]